MNTLAIALTICAVGVLWYLVEKFRIGVLRKLERNK
tara:strand:- start:13 stop:120 length:108 start_codon:yes stop_codon:yes gene_type:complete